MHFCIDAPTKGRSVADALEAEPRKLRTIQADDEIETPIRSKFRALLLKAIHNCAL